jgi:hypothetical protein
MSFTWLPKIDMINIENYEEILDAVNVQFSLSCDHFEVSLQCFIMFASLPEGTFAV